ncbi:MAG: glutamate racemase [Chlorobiaceae bacterium]|nr:glutamate racemase [Chlorobiaceae bacterium]NTV25643.1 glutamate racemase [Chlorobiaceae bacterium]
MPKQYKISPDSPIGIFDSGIGGLTVVKAVRAGLPSERIIYFGDTARVPYGPKSQVTIRRYAREDTEILMKHQPKMIIVACNTVSALALDVVEQTAGNIPVIGVLKAGAELAAQKTRSGKIGVIGTQATIGSNAYACAIREENDALEVVSKACPLFVPLAEEGFIDHAATRLVAEEYLSELVGKGIDTLVLGCTHYPILRRMIERITGPEITIIDSAEAVAGKARQLLGSQTMLNGGSAQPMPHLMVSDLPQKFSELYRLFMGTELPDVELVGV